MQTCSVAIITDVHLTVTSQKFSGVLGHGRSGQDHSNYYIAHNVRTALR